MMTRRSFLAGAAAAATSAGAASRPNVLVVLTDDLGYGDIGAYGVRDIKTPHLDRLARQGVKFAQSYSNGPVCTPTRCALMTGRYQQRVGLEWALVPAQNDYGLPASETTLPRWLKNIGYRTAMYGKWHLGAKPEFGPNAHGFDEFFGIHGGNVDFYRHNNVNGTHDLFENVEMVKREGYLTELLSDRAVQFLDKHAAAGARDPFFLYVPYNAVHWPFQPPGRPGARTRETWFDGSRADYARMVESVDEGVGRILGSLDRNRLAQNTLVIFTNDNGGERYSRNEPFFHHKATLWEGGVRVPTLMRWPGRVPAGKTSQQPMITMDLTATIAAATGSQPRADRPLEGIDLLPAAGGKAPVERTFFWRIERADRKQRAVRKGAFKYIRDGAIEMLFDLEKDPGERLDIAPSHPEKLVQLRKAVAEWEADVDKPAPKFVVR